MLAFPDQDLIDGGPAAQQDSIQHFGSQLPIRVRVAERASGVPYHPLRLQQGGDCEVSGEEDDDYAVTRMSVTEFSHRVM